jgi:hypothetical protein
MAQSTFVVNVPGWTAAFGSPSGTLGKWVRQKGTVTAMATRQEAPRPGKVHSPSWTGLSFATGATLGSIRSRVTVVKKTPEARVIVGTKQALFVIHGTPKTNPGFGYIYPRKPGGWLRFPIGGRIVYARRVHGIHPNNFMDRGLRRGMRGVVRAGRAAGVVLP